MKALLIVDVQNDFCPGGALAVPNGDEVVGPLNEMIDYAKRKRWLIIASRDWHPEKTNHFKDYGGIWPVHCVKNTQGAEFHPDLKLSEKVVVISKGTHKDEDAYSAFRGKWRGVSLNLLLKHSRIKELYVGGLATDYCVKASAMDSAKKGFRTVLLLDACHAVNLQPGDGEKAVVEMKAAGVVITTASEVINGNA